jgi:hypothetical protein
MMGSRALVVLVVAAMACLMAGQASAQEDAWTRVDPSYSNYRAAPIDSVGFGPDNVTQHAGTLRPLFLAFLLRPKFNNN